MMLSILSYACLPLYIFWSPNIFKYLNNFIVEVGSKYYIVFLFTYIRYSHPRKFPKISGCWPYREYPPYITNCDIICRRDLFCFSVILSAVYIIILNICAIKNVLFHIQEKELNSIYYLTVKERTNICPQLPHCHVCVPGQVTLLCEASASSPVTNGVIVDDPGFLLIV